MACAGIVLMQVTVQVPQGTMISSCSQHGMRDRGVATVRAPRLVPSRAHAFRVLALWDGWADGFNRGLPHWHDDEFS